MERVVVNFLLNGIESNADSIVKLTKSVLKLHKRTIITTALTGLGLYSLDKEITRLKRNIKDMQNRIDYLEAEQEMPKEIDDLK